MLPQGIGVIPLHLNVRRGAIDAFKAAIPAYEQKLAELAAAGVDRRTHGCQVDTSLPC
jgi:hypothetical protein